MALQAKMLRFLECGELQRVGENEVIRVDVRVIAATHQNLEVVRADTERNVLLVRGPVPGAKNGLVLISAAVRPPKSAAAAAGGK